MARVKNVVIIERQMKMLSYLVDRAQSQGFRGAVLSLRTIGVDCLLSESQVRLVLRKLRDGGYLSVEPREMPNGGTAENAYRVTSKGCRALAIFEAAGQDEGSGHWEWYDALRVYENLPVQG